MRCIGMDRKKSIIQREEEILKFWKEKKIFLKTIEQKKEAPVYSFYDGPPFATGLPHYGHIVASLMKDVVPRYWTMKGYRVDRRWGWDCHGLPIENIIEEKLNIKSKKDIERIGVDVFNEECRQCVLKYRQEWRAIIERVGRWVDMDHDYKTMDVEYMESVWWVFQQLWKKGLIYRDFKSMHICPRCETTLSQSEVSEGYREIEDLSVIVKFELQDQPHTSILAWTTTPWTLPGNVALALGPNIAYAVVRVVDPKKHTEERYILAKENVQHIFQGKEYRIEGEVHPRDLEGKKYRPLFPWDLTPLIQGNHTDKLYTVQLADFVTVQDGTGVVHIAPAFGEDDMNLAKEKGLPYIQHVGMDGRFRDEVREFSGRMVKPKGRHTETDRAIVDYLQKRGSIFQIFPYHHSYPHCWRCDTPLLNYATTSWFVAVTKIKEEMIQLAKNIHWQPAHLKEGRFGKWLEGARDWAISRQRFWGSVIPIWECECGEIRVFGSIAELQQASGVHITDLHKHIIDSVVIPCNKCQGMMRRIPDVLDCWFESGSMPYAQLHYPFENREKFQKTFPAHFIAEGVDQTRAWFYYLHVIATAIQKNVAFQNVIVNGIVLAEDGRKMSKRLKNYPTPEEIFEKYGADALRYYLLTSPVMRAEDLHFSERGVMEAFRGVILLLENILSFYEMYREDNRNDFLDISGFQPKHVLDRWILTIFDECIHEVTRRMDAYDLPRAARPLGHFIHEFSTWYLRRSRTRFKKGDQEGMQIFRSVLLEFSKILAPFLPFTAEYIYRKVGGNRESVHLEDWPKITIYAQEQERQKILQDMETVRKIVEEALALRNQAGVKVRQPLQKVVVSGAVLSDEHLSLICDEINVKEAVLQRGGDFSVTLDTEITPELKREGETRDLIRFINHLRKEKGLTAQDVITIFYRGDIGDILEQFKEDILRATAARDIIQREDLQDARELAVNGRKIGLVIEST